MERPTGFIWAGPVTDIGGYGNVSRNLLKALEKIGLPIRVHNTGGVSQEIGAETISWLADLQNSDVGPNPYLMIHNTADAFPTIQMPNVGKRIGITIFETDRVPKSWVDASDTVDEIWVPSRFNVDTFANSGIDRGRLKVVQYPIDHQLFAPGIAVPPYSFPLETKLFKFLYCFAFDYRKGFDLLLQAYCEEFSANEDVSFILKVYQPDWMPAADIVSELQQCIPKKPNNPHILLILQRIDQQELKSLYKAVDCYVSTDRANGWGMPAMEMMAMGKPAITIDWSGSTEFMKEDNSFLIKPTGRLEPVDHRLQTARPELYRNHQWAEVEVGEVRRVLREAFKNKERREALSKKAALDMQERFSIDAISGVMKRCVTFAC